MITLPILPFEVSALEPVIDTTTINIHYGKHHQTYVDKLNPLLQDTPFASLSLEEIITQAPAGPIFNNAAQVWNHTFYRNCLRALQEENIPGKVLLDTIVAKRGSFDAFKEAFSTSALNNFGSGRTWLVKTADGQLDIVNTSNAGCPLTQSMTPLLTIDIWEHAYYLQYQNRRVEYIQKRWTLVNRDFVEQCHSDD